MNTCKLCGSNNIQLVKSHIIPKFMFKTLKDESNSFFNFTIRKNAVPKCKKKQIEDYDKTILCSRCDNEIIGSYERYVAAILYGGQIKDSANMEFVNYTHKGVQYSTLTGVDHQRIKKFFLSILWRSSITNLNFHKNVELDFKHEERIRQILYENIEVSPEEYPIIFYSLLNTKISIKNIILEPSQVYADYNGIRFLAYIFYIDGLKVVFYVNSKSMKLPHNIKQFTFQDNNLTFFHLPESIANNFIDNFVMSKL